jgi:hypothetical protein
MKHSPSRLALFVAGALVTASAPAHSETADPIAAVTKAVREVFRDTWEFISAPLSGDAIDTVTPPTPLAIVHSLHDTTDSHFWGDISDAGYDLAEIDTTVGIIPDVKLVFQSVRELSEADRDALERKLEIEEMRDNGVIPKVQRQIIRTLLEASDVSEMRIGKLEIGILPLPSATFTMEPRDAPLSGEHDAIYRAIVNKTRKKPAPDPAVPPAPTAEAPASPTQ